MRIVYLVPGALSSAPAGARELRRRQELLQSWASPDVAVEVRDCPNGPASIESSYEELLGAVAALPYYPQLERAGVDAVILGCFGDPGLHAARELVSIPIVGPGQTSLLTAAEIGHKFSLLTVFDQMRAWQTDMVRQAGVHEKLASVRAMNIPVLEFMQNGQKTLERAVELGRRAIDEDGADTLVLGCMTMAFMDMDAQISAQLGIPVVNAAKTALRKAEMFCRLGLSHSKRAYPPPPKLASDR